MLQDPLVFVLLLIIVVAGGVIGVLADHLGRRIGKKKLSFRSLRPKRVAQVGTFIAGALVSLITILLVYSTSSGIREWITQGRAAIDRSKALTAQNGKLSTDIQSKTSQIDKLDREALVARTRLTDARKKLAAISVDLGNANLELAQARKRVSEGQIALSRNQALLKRNHQLLASRQAELAKIAGNLRDARARYHALNLSYQAVDKERTEANDEVVNLRSQEDNLGNEVRTLKAESTELSREKLQAQQDLQSARTELYDRQHELVNVKSQLDTAKRDLQLAQAQTTTYQLLASSSRSEPLTFGRGEEIARLSVPAHLTERQADDTVTRLLRASSVAAQARGAGATPDSSFCVHLLERRDPDGGIVDPSDLESAIVQALTQSDTQVVLIATAAVNSFKGESVPIQVDGHPDPVVYRKGQVVATAMFARRLAPSAVMTRFTQFMEQRVHDRAIQDGMIPAAGESGSLVNLSPAETIKLVYRLANVDRELQLSAVAHGDVRASEPLQLDFTIK